jgi:hypothetical protein
MSRIWVQWSCLLEHRNRKQDKKYCRRLISKRTFVSFYYGDYATAHSVTLVKKKWKKFTLRSCQGSNLGFGKFSVTGLGNDQNPE